MDQQYSCCKSTGALDQASRAECAWMRVQACTAAWRDFLDDFQSLYLPFRDATQALAALDALQSLAGVARSSGQAALPSTLY